MNKRLSFFFLVFSACALTWLCNDLLIAETKEVEVKKVAYTPKNTSPRPKRKKNQNQTISNANTQDPKSSEIKVIALADTSNKGINRSLYDGSSPYNNSSHSYIYRWQEPVAPVTQYESYQNEYPLEIMYDYVESSPSVIFSLSHIEPKGIGYNEGYTTAEAFFIPGIFNSSYPFIDARFHVFNDGDLAGNIGLGYRSYSQVSGRTFGFNVFYDARQYFGNYFNQLGIGIEFLSGYFDFRANAYVPLGNKKALKRECFFTYPGGYFMDEKQYSLAMSGANFEVGHFLVSNSLFNIYGALGPYLFVDTCRNNIAGAEARLEVYFKKYIYCEALLSHDRLFGTRFQTLVGITIPFGLGSEEYGGDSRSIWSIDRNDIIILRDICCWDWNF